MAAFSVMRALSTRNEAPQEASRPFDAGRDGFVIGEGAGMLVLEELEHARARGARIYAEIVGYGMTSDAFHVALPDATGEAQARAMAAALDEAGLTADDVDYVNAHGTATPAGDIAETRAIKVAFGAHATHVPVSSTKSMTGHLLGAAGAIEALFCVRAITDGVVPPTINLTDPDPDCDLDYVPNAARAVPVRTAMSNSFGFGGHDVSLGPPPLRGLTRTAPSVERRHGPAGGHAEERPRRSLANRRRLRGGDPVQQLAHPGRQLDLPSPWRDRSRPCASCRWRAAGRSRDLVLERERSRPDSVEADRHLEEIVRCAGRRYRGARLDDGHQYAASLELGDRHAELRRASTRATSK